MSHFILSAEKNIPKSVGAKPKKEEKRTRNKFHVRYKLSGCCSFPKIASLSFQAADKAHAQTGRKTVKTGMNAIVNIPTRMNKHVLPFSPEKP